MTASPETLSHDAYARVRYFGSLDGLRAASILAVLWHHAEMGWDFLPMFPRGFLGVDMFFVISGFLIVTLLLREREKSGDVSLKNFYARRSLRIFPVYYTLVILAALALWLVLPDSTTAHDILPAVPYLLTYTINWVAISGGLFGIAWSLAAEEQFYFFWPPLEKLTRGRVWLGYAAIVALLAVNQAMNFGAFASVLDPELEIVQITFTPILLGVLLAYLLHHRASYERLAKVLGHRGAPVVALAATLVAINIPGDDIAGWPRLTMQLSMAALLGSSVIREDHHLRGLLQLAPLRRVGMVSYGVYLYHMFVLVAVDAALDRSPVRFPGDLLILYSVATVVVAELSFRFYETPILKLKTRFQAA